MSMEKIRTYLVFPRFVARDSLVDRVSEEELSLVSNTAVGDGMVDAASLVKRRLQASGVDPMFLVRDLNNEV
jgi:lactate dehydrogenase-like 2-hydroxyacid dehydrogenase